MAYGLEVVDLIYTDPNLNDVGTLSDYSADLDLCGEKDFELECNEFVMQKGSVWYVEDTEFGGIVDGYDTNSKEQVVKYIGRSWRGILASKIVYEGEETVVNDPNDSDNTLLVTRQFSYKGQIKDIFNNLLETYKLNGFFVCDDPILSDDDLLLNRDYAESTSNTSENVPEFFRSPALEARRIL